MESLFRLKEHGTDLKTEIIAGFTTFVTMGYILVVNPLILGETGMDPGAIFTATALSAGIATLVMAFYAKLPFALAPGMGLNAFFAYTIVLGMEYPWEFALTAVFLEGLAFILLTALNVREAIVNAIPDNLKKAISVGIGLFIAFIGLQNAGMIVDNPTTLVGKGSIGNAPFILASLGLIITSILMAFRVRGALLIGIVVCTIIGIPLGVTQRPSEFISLTPPSLAPIAFKFDFSQVLSFDMLIVVFTFLLVDMFDTLGTLIGVSTKAGLLDSKGKIPRIKQALMADAVGTTVGACLGTSTVTTYVESAAGVEEGGRTGLTALITGLLFLLSLSISPLVLMIPGAATAPALIIVGLFMVSPIKEIELTKITEALPAFLTMIMMPLTYSISDGIIFGMLSYIFLKVLTGKGREVPMTTYVVAGFFIFQFIFEISG